ncbi:hypothetical protein Lgra_1351 [Legionella gratiana]|uniref:Uncharacterized protein n=1 Tax=Legionella gratiana TaxID=45066 RepID=A0A378JFW3_9GAMM|nr:hypothetical protein [Legionella gratiana]KTD11893.1 hypothetical protein Lgra_1351 [Legionella gratiana]STX46515.1 Uncharacterised protein [Legionella gratiana]
MSAVKNVNGSALEGANKKIQIEKIKEKLNTFLNNKITHLKHDISNNRTQNQELLKSDSECTLEEKIQKILKNIAQAENNLAKSNK